MGEETWRPPGWMYRNRRPPNDDAYFENMTRIIFQAGLNWKVIDKKWPNFKKAFGNFSIDRVSKLKAPDVERLMKDEGIVRNRAKITATVENANRFKSVREKFGSFQSYLDSLDKSNNYALIVGELGKRFQRLGPSSARIFLFTVGEDIKRSMEE